MRRTMYLMTIAAALLLTAGPARAQTSPAASTQSPAASTIDKADEFSEAVRKGDLARVRALLDAGVNVNTKFRYDRTALSYAADRGNAAMTELLLARGADLTIKDTFYGFTPFMIAIGPARDHTAGHTDVVRVMLKHGKFSADQLSGALQTAKTLKLPDVAELLEQAIAAQKNP